MATAEYPLSTLFGSRATVELPNYRTWTEGRYRRPASDLWWTRRYESWTEDGQPFGCWRWEAA